MVKVTVDLDPRVFNALKVIAETYGLSVEELVAQGARGECDGFLSCPTQYSEPLAEKTAEKVKEILDTEF